MGDTRGDDLIDDLTKDQTADNVDRGDDFKPTEDEPLTLGADFDVDLLKTVAGDAVIDGDDPDRGGDDKGDGGEKPSSERDGAIPRARFDEVLAKTKAQEEELRLLREQLAGKGGDGNADQGKPTDDQGQQNTSDDLRAQLKELRQQAKDAMLEGEDALHDELNDKIDELTLQIAEQRAFERLQATTQQAALKASMADVAKDAYARFPFLDPDSGTTDQDAISAVLNRRAELQAEGLSAAEALRKAVDEKGPKFAKLHGLETDGDGGQADAEAVRQKRQESAQRKASDASVKQPARVEGNERDPGFKVDVSRLDEAAYEKLPESVKAKMRGDTL